MESDVVHNSVMKSICFPWQLVVEKIRHAFNLLRNYENFNDKESLPSNENKNYKEDMKMMSKTFQNNFTTNLTKSDLKPSDLDWLRIVGTGSFGMVYVAKMKKKEYAVKVFDKDKARKLIQTHILDRERAIQGSIEFPFIVKLHSTFTTCDNIFMVMDYCSGEDLFELVDKKCVLSDNDSKFYAAQLVLAIEFLHSNNIIHRDIKLDNAVLCSDGYLKLTDFGFAKVTEGRTRTLCGSREYLAPEILRQFAGLTVETYNFTVDWWSLGICLYVMGIGKMPFGGEMLREIYDDILEDKVEYPSYLNPDLAHLIQQLLIVDGELRLGSRGTNCVKAHAWFSDVYDWSQIFYKRVKAPYIPSEGVLKHVDVTFSDDREIDEYVNF